MKIFIKAVSLVVSIMMLLGIVSSLSSCKSGDNDNNKNENLVTIIEDGKSDYTLVRPESVDPLVLESIVKLHKAISDKFNIKMEFATDWLKGNQQPDSALCEILVGNTNRPESKEVLDSLEDNTWAVVKKGNKIVICAKNDALLDVAIDWFIKTYIDAADTVLAIPEDLDQVDGYGDNIPLNVNGISSYNIVYPETDLNAQYYAQLVQRHTRVNGQNIPVVSANRKGSEMVIEIKSASGADGTEYTIKSEGNSVEISATGETALYYGVNYFLENYVEVSDTVATMPASINKTGKIDGYSKSGWDLGLPYFDEGMIAPVYNIGTGLAIDKSADTVYDSKMHLISRANATMFASYQNKLESFGFVKSYYAKTDKNELVGYRLGEIFAYVHYAPNQSYMRVIWDKSSNCMVSDFETTAKPNGTTTFYQYSLDYTGAKLNYSGTGLNCGMLYVIKLADNSLILVDSGHNAQSSDAALKGICEFLYKITGTGRAEALNIKFWYFTHPDGDHNELTTKLLNYMKSNGYKAPNINTLGFNYPSERANDVVSKTDGSYQMIEYMMENYPNVNYVKLHTGLVFNIDEVKVETLGSIENIVNTDGKIESNFDTNDTCSLVRFSFDGVSFLMTGDIGNHVEVQKKHIEMYSKEFFKSTVLQASHHGYNRIYDLYRHAACEYNLVSNAEANVRDDVQKTFLSMFGKDKVLYAGDYTYGFNVSGGKITIETLLRYDNPDYKN